MQHRIENNVLEQVNVMKYLGVQINGNSGDEVEIDARIADAVRLYRPLALSKLERSCTTKLTVSKHYQVRQNQKRDR